MRGEGEGESGREDKGSEGERERWKKRERGKIERG